MTEDLLIVFVKNLRPGHVKTRLAKTIGDENAITIYKALVNITENATRNINADLNIYFSDALYKTPWPGAVKKVQRGGDLGERMVNAFQDGFNEGYKQIVLIGSDLPEIDSQLIEEALEKLRTNEVVFGPAKDGGYYLIGLSKLHQCLFKDKPWSTAALMKHTLDELESKKIKASFIETLNDIDTFEDLKGYPELLKMIT